VTPARLRLGNPIGLLFSSAPWVALSYLFCWLFVGSLWFGLAFTLLCTGLTLSITWFGLPVLAFALRAVRAMANVERQRVRIAGVAPVAAPYRTPQASGLRPRLRERLRDPATRRDAVVLVGLWAPLFILDTVVITLWLAFAALITLPVWYRYVPQTFDNGTTAHGVDLGNFPNGPKGGDSWGFFIGDLHSALVAAGVGALLLVLVGNYLLVATAKAHVWVTVSLLREARDPLADAKQMARADPLVRISAERREAE
jgi:hypothetical protein